MTSVITFAAWSHTGKTTYLEKLIPELKKMGLRVAIIKHDVHDLQLDVEGTDSWRLMAAGADTAAVVSSNQLVVMDRRRRELEEIISHLSDADLILTEGYKHGPYPRIALFRSGSGKPLAVPPEECLAIVSDVPVDAPCPVFPLDDARPLAQYLLAWLKTRDRK